MPLTRYPKAVWLSQTRNNSGRFKVGQPEIIVYHYTAAGSGKGSADYLSRPHVPSSSAHFVIDRDGTVYQLSEINIKTWHAGSSSWGKRVGINSYGIGIEIANYGYWREELTRWIPDPKAASWLKLTHKNEHTPRFWEPYTDKQYRALEELTAWLLQTIPTLQIQVGHDDISPGRKADPGPAFDMARMKAVFVTVRNPKPKPVQPAPAATPLMSAAFPTPAPVATMDTPHRDLEHKGDDLSLDSLSLADGGKADIKDVVFYKSGDILGLDDQHHLANFCGHCSNGNLRRSAFLMLTVADLAQGITVIASFIGDAIVARGRIKAVNSDTGVARQITFKKEGVK
jgi:N-acetyl-anhydromuramyl-L-alanine amidase AmpD